MFHAEFKHLHGAAVPIGDLLFAGYSGCETQWGLNPVWRTLLAGVEVSHRPLLDRLAAAEAADRAQRAKMDEGLNTGAVERRRQAVIAGELIAQA